MKQLIYFLILVTFFALTKQSSAQGFTFVPFGETYVHNPYIPDSNQVIQFRGIVRNTSSSSLNFRFVRLTNNIPADWETQMCYDVCYAGTVDTIPLTFFGPYTIEANHVDTLFYIDFTCRSQGLGTASVRMYNSDNPSLYVDNTFQVEIGGSGVINISSEITDYNLSQNYPNPFNPVTLINFSIPKSSNVSLKVYDVLGNEVEGLINNQYFPAGKYKVDFNASRLSSGIYYYTLRADGFVDSRKMMLVK